MVFINQSIVLIALPAIFRGIHLNPLTPSNTGYMLWMLMGFMVVLAVLLVTLGRVGDMFGRVKMYNLGFAVFTVFSILLSVTWMHGPGAAIWLIAMRIGQGVGGAMLFANSSAIITDAFPANQRGLGLGINNVAAIAGAFIGLVLGGLLAPVQWHMVFLVSVPFGIFGTVWAYRKLEDRSVRTPAHIDWWGNATFAAGLILILVGITYGLLPYGHHTMGWTSPVVMTEIIGGLALLAVFCVIETRVRQSHVPADAVPHPRLHGRQRGQRPGVAQPGRAHVHADHLAPGDLAAPARLQLQLDPAVGRHLHGAVDRRLPGRRAAGRAIWPTSTAPAPSPPAACCWWP